MSWVETDQEHTPYRFYTYEYWIWGLKCDPNVHIFKWNSGRSNIWTFISQLEAALLTLSTVEENAYLTKKKASAESAFISSCCLSRLDWTSSATSNERHCKGTLHHRSTRSLRPELWHVGTKARTQAQSCACKTIAIIYSRDWSLVICNPRDAHRDQILFLR